MAISLPWSTKSAPKGYRLPIPRRFFYHPGFNLSVQGDRVRPVPKVVPVHGIKNFFEPPEVSKTILPTLNCDSAKALHFSRVATLRAAVFSFRIALVMVDSLTLILRAISACFKPQQQHLDLIEINFLLIHMRLPAQSGLSHLTTLFSV